MGEPLTVSEMLRLCEAADWEINEATGDVSAISEIIDKARKWAESMREVEGGDGVMRSIP